MEFTKEQLIEQAKSSIERYSKAKAGFPRHLNVAMELELARIALAALTQTPAVQAEQLQKLIEGMEVSVDVSTCDADAVHRYFGTVTEVSDLPGAKNGHILLVQDAQPNFKRPGNSPAIPDGWIPVSERMPEAVVTVLISNGADIGKAYWLDEWGYDFDGDKVPGDVTHWMPLPNPPRQEAE
ncbi:DUF551 domain-containing protein [Atlantibacter subterranea]|uniref:DUF551 domain-containing protein n=1 Tax=Atlantibacter subterraneus TaxID=255519 RepID=UPI0020C4E9BF|nr:DUF551 domain-containing protein [Atlantibacter subterranea]UTJ46610.1 DUF551 domain-containing protein [Atlantibacter subterranea]